MRRLLLLFIVIFMPSMVMAHGNGLSDTYPHIGKGCTTLYYLDEDCDGYGVGEAYVIGPDPDDSDADITTSSSVYTKYAKGGTNLDTVSNFFQAGRGYTGILRYIFVATNGNDSTCSANANINTAATTPCQTISKARDLHAAGDMVIIRGGTYTEVPYWEYGVDGTPSHPVYIVAYPGEKVILDNISGTFTVSKAYHTIDGIILQNTATQLGRGFNASGSDHVTIRNCEARQLTNGEFSMQKIRNHLIEHNVFHDMDASGDGTHIIYLGARDEPNSDITVRGNIFYKGNYPGIQHNGRVTNLTIEKNILHSVNMGAFSIEMGGTNITIRNNVIFNTHQMLVAYWYGGNSDTPGAPSEGILPYPLSNLVVENNTYYKSLYTYKGASNGWLAIDIGDGIGYNVDTWQTNHSYTENQTTGYVKPTTPNGWIYACTKAGNSGSSEPTWPAILGQKVSDGTTEWIAYADNGVNTPHIDGLQIRNNIITMEGWAGSGGQYDYLIKFSRDWFIDSNHIGKIENNLFYRYNDFSTKARVWLKPDGTAQSFDQFQAFDTSNWRNNVWANPLFNAVSADYYSAPGNYDFRTSDTSPAKSIGIAEDAPADDLTGKTRIGYDAGAYAISATTTASTEYSTQKVKDNGADKSHIVIHIISSGFDSSHQAEATAQCTKHFNNLFATNYFGTKQSNFNVYRTLVKSPSNGVKLNFTDLHTIGHVVAYDYLVIIHNFSAAGAQQYTSDAPAGWYDNVYELYLDDQDYILPHEMAHLLSYYGNPVVSIGDEYTNELLCTGMSKYVFNSHDQNSNEKWSDLISASPTVGSRYCSTGLWRPRPTCVMNDTATTHDFCEVCYKALEKVVGKHPKIGSIEGTAPSLTVTGIDRDGKYSGRVTVGVTAADAFGIERAEFYFGKYDGIHWTGEYVQKSVRIVRSTPYTWDLDTAGYPNGRYAVDVLVYDTNWNVTRRMNWFTIDNSIENLPPGSPKNLRKAN